MRVLFDFRRPYFLTGYYLVFDELRRRGVEVAITPMQAEYEDRFQEFVAAHCPQLQLLNSSAAIEQSWDLILVAGGLYERSYNAGQVVGRINHGGCIGNSRSMYPLDSFQQHQMQVFFGLNQRDIALGERYYPGMWDGKITKVVGWPKLDRLMQSPIDRAKRLQELGLDPRKKTVVFTSHWTENSLIRTIGLNVIAALGLLPEYNVIVTAHPLVFTDVKKSLGGDPHGVLLALCRQKSHMRFLPEADSAQVIPLGDLFITDYSSITYELAALNRPILWYCDSSHDFSDDVLKELTIAATYPFKRIQALPKLLSWVNAHATEKEVERLNVAKYVYAHLGRATEVYAQAIIDAVEEVRAQSAAAQ